MGNRMMKNAAFLLLTVCILFLCFSGYAEPMHQEIENSAFDMEVTVGYEGLMTYGKVMPVRVRIRNFGDDLEGILGVNAYVSNKEYDRYEAAVSVPAGSQREYVIMVSVYARQDVFTAELVKNGKVLCAANGTPGTVINPSAMLIGVLSTRPQSLNNLNIDRDNDTLARYEQWKTVPLTADTFPEDPRALRSFGILMIDDTDPSSLSVKQQKALDEWLKSGRVLICGGGSNAGKSVAFIGGYTGLRLEGITTSDSVVEGLENLLGRAVSGKSVSVSLAEYSGTDPLARDAEGHGLLYRTPVGNGQIYTAAFETGEPRLNSESLMHYFWQQILLDQDPSLYSSIMYADSDSYSSGAVSLGYSVPVHARSFMVPGLLIVSATLIICCACWWILKRKDRRQWMWAVFPVISLLAAAGILLLSSGAETNRPLAVISENLVQDSAGTMRSYKGISVAVPAYGIHSYSMAGDKLRVRTYNYVDYEEEENGERKEPDRLRTCYSAGGEDAVMTESTYAWEPVNLYAESDAEVRGRIEGEIWMEEDGIHGEITNGTDLDLAEGYLITTYGYSSVPALAPGETTEILLVKKQFADPANPVFENGGMYQNSQGLYAVIYSAAGYNEKKKLSAGQEQERSMIHDMLNGALDTLRQEQGNRYHGSYESAVFAYSAKPLNADLPDLKVDGEPVKQKAGSSMMTAGLPFTAVGRTGIVFRSAGMDIPVCVETDENFMPTDEPRKNVMQTDYYSLSEVPTFRYILEGLDGLEVKSLRVLLDTWYAEQARVYALNAQKHQWEEIRLNEDVKEPGRYLDENGRLYLQFRTDSTDMYADIPTPLITLEGRLEYADN